MLNKRSSQYATNEPVGVLPTTPGPAFSPSSAPVQFLRKPNLSLRSKMLLAFFVLIVILGIPYIFLAIPILQYQTQYNRIIDNITAANSINGYIKFAIDAEMWDIIAGKEDFYTADQYAILDDVEAKLAAMREISTSQRGKLKLRVIQNTMDTLRHNIDRVGVDISAGATFDENMVLLERIRWVSTLVEESVQDYMLFEVNRTEQQYRALQAGLQQWIYASVIGMLAAVAFSIVAALRISRSIYLPIKKLHDVTTTIAHEDLEPLVTSDNVDEITELGMSFNIMVGKVRELVAAKMQEQENLKKAELRALQAQINPHFLYNTLDTIIWMVESKHTTQVVDLVRALSRFFRISLSKGEDWITVGDEFEHVTSYLAIQKIRYRDILDYQIDVNDAILSATILKLTLQPLVENALYHGIKNKRNGGMIRVCGQKHGDAFIHIEIADNGMGMTPERLAQVRAALLCDTPGTSEGGYGLINVNQRIRLYYGQRYGLTIASKYSTGTTVSMTIPLRRLPEHDSQKI
jgi:two-component system sensor histidine kinase YesM